MEKEDSLRILSPHEPGSHHEQLPIPVPLSYPTRPPPQVHCPPSSTSASGVSDSTVPCPLASFTRLVLASVVMSCPISCLGIGGIHWLSSEPQSRSVSMDECMCKHIGFSYQHHVLWEYCLLGARTLPVEFVCFVILCIHRHLLRSSRQLEAAVRFPF